jgi:hypothetical protein
MLKLSYLLDIYSEINNLNISMQGSDQTLIGLTEKLTAFKGKLKLWKRKILMLLPLSLRSTYSPDHFFSQTPSICVLSLE